MSDEETIFAKALSKGSASERDAYLDQACAENAALRQNVDALLLAHHKGGGILESPPAALEPITQTPALTYSIGTMIGPRQIK